MKKIIERTQATTYVPIKPIATGHGVSDLSDILPSGKTICGVLIDLVEEVVTKDGKNVYLVATVMLKDKTGKAHKKRVFCSEDILRNQYANNRSVCVTTFVNEFNGMIRINGSLSY